MIGRKYPKRRVGPTKTKCKEVNHRYTTAPPIVKDNPMMKQTLDEYSMASVIDELCSDPDAFNTEREIDSEDDVVEWYPEEYVILVNGFRGGGKSLLVCWWGLWYLKYRPDVPVFTNLDYIREKLEQEHFTSFPDLLKWDEMISFEWEQPLGAMNQIDEVDTYLDRLRTVSNQSVLATKFLEQLRKRSLKFILSCQFGNYLPGGTLDQVDLSIQSHDLFFTPAGRENGLVKGEKFLYICTDKSGLFTGGRQQAPILFTLDGRGVWGYYETNKLHDPMQFAKKFKIMGGEKEVDQATGEMYPSEEARAQDQERIFRQYRETIQTVWGSNFMGWVQTNADHLGVKDMGNSIRIKKDRIEQGLSQVRGPSHMTLQGGYRKVLEIAEKNGGVIVRQGDNLEILKPEYYKRSDEEVVSPEGEVFGYEKIQ